MSLSLRSTYLLGAAFASVLLVGCSERQVAPKQTAEVAAYEPVPTKMRRLTETHYLNTVADIFGPDIVVPGFFEAVVRPDHGLSYTGASHISVSPAGLEQYAMMAQSIATQVADVKHRDLLIPCKPQAANKADDACAAQFYTATGRLLFRRPLTDNEVREHTAKAREATGLLSDFYLGLALGLERMLVSPQFLFQVETTVRDPKAGGEVLDDWSRASRLSFMLWNTTPDQELLDAAGRGELRTKLGLERQVERLLASPRLKAGVQAFFADMLDFGSAPIKDAIVYPKFVRQVTLDMREQSLRTITDLLLRQDGDYRDLFTTRQTFMTKALGVVYKLPVNAEASDWVPYEFPADQPRAGLLTQLQFLSTFSHPGRSSATLRGKAFRELFLCQAVPSPPGNVDFSVVQETHNPVFKTARQRLQEHATNPVCAGCHKITDPIGLSLEVFDGIGEYRTGENGAPIDTSGDFEGKKFTGPAGLAQLLHDSPAVPKCLVQRVLEYGIGMQPTRAHMLWLEEQQRLFAADGYRMRALLRRITTSPDFYRAVSQRS